MIGAIHTVLRRDITGQNSIAKKVDSTIVKATTVYRLLNSHQPA